MLQASPKKWNFLLIYQCILAMGAVLAFFTNFDLFFFMAGMGPPPTLYILIFLMGSLPIWYVYWQKRIQFLFPVIVWLGCFLTFSMLSLALSSFSALAIEESNRRIVTTIFILTMAVIFSGSVVVQLWARRAVLIAMVISTVNVIIELFNPMTFAVIDFPDRPPGTLRYADRPSGLYIDPNKTAFALVLGLIFCTHLLPPKYRIPFVFVVGIVIFLTFSRGAILCWLILLFIYSFTGVISGKTILYWGLGSVVFITVLFVGGIIDIQQLHASGIITDDMMGRLEWFQNPLAKEDSADSRKEVAATAFQMFLDNPILGNGIASTLALSIGISTHNTYLYFMADHGILGALVVPSLVYATAANIRGENRPMGLMFMILVSLWACFCHTLTDDRYILTGFALMAAIKATDSEQEEQCQSVF
jgi:O-Antigen ligase